MGIKDLNELIKRHALQANFVISIEELTGKKIAIDGNGWMYANLAIARKKVINKTDVTIKEPDPIEIRKELHTALINFIEGWLIYGITPIFVFDGKNGPSEKADVKAKRQEKRTTARAKIDEMYEKLNQDPLMNNGKIVEDLRKALRNYLCFTAEDFESTKTLLSTIGIPCFQAKGEGEKLCSAFCVEEQVAAVFSVDTDNLVYGCPLLITGHSSSYSYDQFNNRVPNLDCVRVDKVLEGLKINYSTFIDLCIMCGCDFNTNIPRYGAIKSYDLLMKHGAVEKIPLDITCLRLQRCREIFSFTPSKDLIEDYEDDSCKVINLDVNKDAMKTCRDYMDVIGMSSHITKLTFIYQNLIPCQPGLLQKLELTNVVTNIKKIPVKRLTLNIVSK